MAEQVDDFVDKGDRGNEITNTGDTFSYAVKSPKSPSSPDKQQQQQQQQQKPRSSSYSPNYNDRGRSRGGGRGGRHRGRNNSSFSSSNKPPYGSTDMYYPMVGSPYGSAQMLPPIFAVPGYGAQPAVIDGSSPAHQIIGTPESVAEETPNTVTSSVEVNSSNVSPMQMPQQVHMPATTAADMNSPLMWQQFAAQMMYYGYPPPQLVTNEQGMMMFTYPTMYQPSTTTDPNNGNPVMLMPVMPQTTDTLSELPPAAATAGYMQPPVAYPYPVDPNAAMMMMMNDGIQNMSIIDPTQHQPPHHTHQLPQERTPQKQLRPLPQGKYNSSLDKLIFVETPKPSHILEIYDIKDPNSLEIPGAKIKTLSESVKLAVFKNSIMANEALQNATSGGGDEEGQEKYKLRPWEARIEANMTIPPVTKHHHHHQQQQQQQQQKENK